MNKRKYRGIKKHGLTVTAIIGISLIMACGWRGGIQARNYYIISYTPAPQKSALSNRPYPYSLQVGRFEVQRIFNRQNIMYRFSPHQLQYYEFQQWAVRPDQMITDMVVKHLEASNIVNRVGTEFFETRPDFRIDGTVVALEKLDAGDLFFSHLAMSFKMVRIEDGAQIWDYSFDQRRQVFQPEMVYTVRSMSAIFQSQMDVVVSQIDSLFLSLETGTSDDMDATVSPDKAPETISVPKEPAAEDLNESDFEIIPEKNRQQKEK